MRQIECVFEAEVLAAVIQSRWPDRMDTELRDHARTCEICADAAAVARAMEFAREDTAEGAALPDSGRVWWKAQMRARREAVEAAGRPITAIRIVAFTCAVGLMGACIGATSGWFQTALKETWAAATSVDWKSFVPYATGVVSAHWMLAAGMATLFLVMPVAVYLAIVKD